MNLLNFCVAYKPPKLDSDEMQLAFLNKKRTELENAGISIGRFDLVTDREDLEKKIYSHKYDVALVYELFGNDNIGAGSLKKWSTDNQFMKFVLILSDDKKGKIKSNKLLRETGYYNAVFEKDYYMNIKLVADRIAREVTFDEAEVYYEVTGFAEKKDENEAVSSLINAKNEDTRIEKESEPEVQLEDVDVETAVNDIFDLPDDEETDAFMKDMEGLFGQEKIETELNAEKDREMFDSIFGSSEDSEEKKGIFDDSVFGATVEEKVAEDKQKVVENFDRLGFTEIESEKEEQVEVSSDKNKEKKFSFGNIFGFGKEQKGKISNTDKNEQVPTENKKDEAVEQIIPASDESNEKKEEVPVTENVVSEVLEEETVIEQIEEPKIVKQEPVLVEEENNDEKVEEIHVTVPPVLPVEEVVEEKAVVVEEIDMAVPPVLSRSVGAHAVIKSHRCQIVEVADSDLMFVTLDSLVETEIAENLGAYKIRVSIKNKKGERITVAGAIEDIIEDGKTLMVVIKELDLMQMDLIGNNANVIFTKIEK